MKPLPPATEALVIRTDVSDDAAWIAIQRTIQKPVGEEGFLAYVHFVDDRAYDGASPDDLLPLLIEGRPRRYFAIIADRTTMIAPDHPLLILDAGEEPGRTFRAIPTAIQSIENNLSLANMDFHEFADSVDADGIFRDFH
jgi:uncharacterized protein DUF6924